MPSAIRAVLFDLGGVLVDWDPRHLYRKLFRDEAAMETFLAEICSPGWHAETDRGRPMQEGVELLCRTHPEQAEMITAYAARWEEMFAGSIAGTVAILEELHAAGWPLYALTNFPAEKFAAFRARFAFTGLFDGIVVSGSEKMAKPDAALYECLLERFGLKAEETVFIDDMPANVEAARRLGFDAIRFTAPPALRAALEDRGLFEDKARELQLSS